MKNDGTLRNDVCSAGNFGIKSAKINLLVEVYNAEEGKKEMKKKSTYRLNEKINWSQNFYNTLQAAAFLPFLKIRTTRTINANHLSQHKTTRSLHTRKRKNCMSTANNLLFDSRQASNGTVRIKIRIKQKKTHTRSVQQLSLYGHRQLQPKLQNVKCASTLTQYGIAADGEYT